MESGIEMRSLAGRGSAGPFLSTLAVALLLVSTSSAQESVADAVNRTRTTLEKWAETQGLISKEKKDWMLGRQVLMDRIELVEQEIAAQRARIADAEKSLDAAAKNEQELTARVEHLRSAASGLTRTVVAQETRTRQLLTLIPKPLREELRVLSARMPEDSENTKLGLGERFQYVIGVLHAINNFDREIKADSEVLELSDGKKSQVTTLYLGLGQAYYVNGKGDAAGVGTLSEAGWVWTPANEAAMRIANALGILNNEPGHVAAFVQLPLRIQ